MRAAHVTKGGAAELDWMETAKQFVNNYKLWIAGVFAVAVLASILGALIRRIIAERGIRSAEERTSRILSDATKDARL